MSYLQDAAPFRWKNIFSSESAFPPMAVIKRRARLITFRVSDEEFNLLQQVSADSGARSLSDFARSAVLHRAALIRAPRSLLTEDLATLSKDLSELDKALMELRSRIVDVLGSTRGDE